MSLQAATLSDAFEDYFRQSEQLPTRLLLAADGHRAAGLILQKLPGDEGDSDGWNRAGALFDTLQADELLAVPGSQLLHRLFHEEQPAILAERTLRFTCSCSRERVAVMLQSLGGEEARAAPVSYTHLDVYKRQAPSIPGFTVEDTPPQPGCQTSTR